MRAAPRLLLLIAPLLPTFALPAQVRRTTVPITAALVAETLTSAGLPLTGPQIQLPPGLEAAGSEPALQLGSAELLTDGHLRVRFTCRQSGACQPFFALVTPLPTQGGVAAIAALRQGLATASSRPATKQELVAGQYTTLLLEDTHMQITLPVIAIDSGPVGAEVRVSSLDRKQTFQAVVIGERVVRGSLP